MKFSDGFQVCDTSHGPALTLVGPWRERNLDVELTSTQCLDSDSAPELHQRFSKRRRQTVSYSPQLMNNITNSSRARGLSLFMIASPSQTQAAPPSVQAPITHKPRTATQSASILDLPNELLSHILISGASSDWSYCLDYELFCAFRGAHPHLRRFALSELMRLYPQMLDYDPSTSAGPQPSTPTQTVTYSSIWKSHLQEAIENPMTRSTWNLMRYDPIRPTHFFNAAVAGCPAALYVKKISLFANDVYFTLSLDNNLPHFPSTMCRPILWSRLREISLDCYITDGVASYILSQAHQTLEVAAFNLKGPGFCRTPVRQSFITNLPASGSVCMDVLHSLKIDTSVSLRGLFDGIALPSLQELELVSYPKSSGFFRSSSRRVDLPHTPILNPGLNIPWSSIKHLVLSSYENLNTNLDDIAMRCTQVEHIELTGVRTNTYSYPSFVKSTKSH